MTIGQLASTTRFPASTIRYYEKIGVLPCARRESGQRRYGADAIDKLGVLKLAQACGFTLNEMKLLLQGFHPDTTPPERWRILARQKMNELDRQMESLSLMRKLVERVAACKCIDLAECGRTACDSNGQNFVAIK